MRHLPVERYVVPKKRLSLTYGRAVDWPWVSSASYSPPAVSIGQVEEEIFG